MCQLRQKRLPRKPAQPYRGGNGSLVLTAHARRLIVHHEITVPIYRVRPRTAVYGSAQPNAAGLLHGGSWKKKMLLVAWMVNPPCCNDYEYAHAHIVAPV